MVGIEARILQEAVAIGVDTRRTCLASVPRDCSMSKSRLRFQSASISLRSGGSPKACLASAVPARPASPPDNGPATAPSDKRRCKPIVASAITSLNVSIEPLGPLDEGEDALSHRPAPR